jgi:hypothetical protein
MPITVVTRGAIIDGLAQLDMDWSGRLSQREFLSDLYDLSELPSNDPRKANALEDIIQHTEEFAGDWPPLWVLSDKRFNLDCDDERLLRFLEKMLHPTVRPDTKEVLELVQLLNSHLVHDGWHLVKTSEMSGRPIFEARQTSHVNPIIPSVDDFGSAYVKKQIDRAQRNIEQDPELAIGSAKELIETTCKTILTRLGQPLKEDLPALVRATLDHLSIDLTGVHDLARAQNAVRRLLGSLSGLGAGVAEVRNAVGTGHGRDASAGDIQSMYARLTVNATATLVTFMMDRFRFVLTK